MKKWVLIVLIVGVLVIGTIGVLAAYTFDLIDLGGKEAESKGSGKPLKNPTEGLSDEEAVMKFDESFVYYILASIGAGNLHNPPLSSDTPKIEFYIDQDVYGAEIVEGRIKVLRGGIDSEDIQIRTSKLEAVKMTRTKSYVAESFSNGGSNVELVASKATLASKGYLSLVGQFS